MGAMSNVIPLHARRGPIASAVAPRLWCPDPGEPELAAWWQPLLRFARRVRVDRVPWPVHIDEFHLIGCVRRAPRPPVWLYRHLGCGGEVAVAPNGLPFRFVPDRNGGGRFVETEVRRAVWAAGLPLVVDPDWTCFDDAG
jgi:hypothetical protein